FGDSVQGPRVGLGEELPLLRVADVTLRQFFVHPVRDDVRGRVVAEQVVDGGGQLEGALVAVPAHRGQPPRVHHPSAEDPGGLLGQATGAHGAGVGRVADVGVRVAAGQRPDRGDHAAVVLEVVVGVGDVVLF